MADQVWNCSRRFRQAPDLSFAGLLVVQALAVWIAVQGAGALAADPASQEPKQPRFETDVAPLLKSRCWKCHAGTEPKGGLRLTTRREILRGGISGPAMRVAAAESSLLWERITSQEMPADGPPLTAEEKGLLRTWINAGAPGDAADNDAEEIDRGGEGARSSSHWAFQTPVRPPIPQVPDATGLTNPIDAFVAARLQANGLVLSREANREVLIRRASYDLLGLPPAPEDVEEFLADPAEEAYERLLDRLLASPRYGERWGRHWLDLAGYADTAGVLSEDRPLTSAYRYRDYVIAAFNADKPYDRFLLEQLAGDELSDYWTAYETLDRLPDEVVEAVTATGFLRCAPDASRPDFSTIKNADAQYYYPTLNDTLQIVASTTMGLTLQCARCHSHKYDPIPQVEFYRLQAIFMSALRPQAWIPQMERRVFIASALQKREADEHNARLDTEAKRLTTELDETRERFRIRLLDERLLTLPEPIRDDLRQAVAKKGDERSPVERYLVEKLGSVVAPDPTALAKLLPERYPEFRSDVERHNQSLAALERQRRHLPELRALYDLPGTVSTPLLRRGDPLTPGAPVEPGVLTALAVPEPFAWQPPATSAKTSGRRLAFARWLTQPGHPLTARVMVNRLWLHHFGEGLVGTPEDFGTLGAPPTHPELLDWLAREFVEGGWRLKRLHRLLMTSRVYRQQSLAGSVEQAAAREVDPENRWLWRQRLRRLEAEPLRDAVLAVTGLLDQAMYGTPIPLARRPGGEVTVADGASDRRRAVYLQVSRSNPLTLLHAFDQPVMETNCTRRGRSTVATQALTLLNSDWMQQAAEALADRLTHEAGGAPIAAAVRLAYSRQPLPSELTDFEEFVQRQRSNYATSGADDASAMRRALADLCHMLLSANEFVYVD